MTTYGSFYECYFFLDANFEKTIQLRMAIHENYGFFNIAGTDFIFNIPNNATRPFTWNHMCFGIGKTNYYILTNGKKWYDFNHRLPNFTLENLQINRLIIGSSPSSIYGKAYVFYGKISEINIWNIQKSMEELKEISKNCDGPRDIPDILNWSGITQTKFQIGNSQVIIADRNISGMCYSSPAKEAKMISIAKNSNDSKLLCEVLNGEMHIPSSKVVYFDQTCYIYILFIML